jgi:dienelactone hydrolase
MKRLLLLLPLLLLQGCFILENAFFPVWEPLYFDEPPAAAGPYALEEKRIEIEDGYDGAPFGITVFAPVDAPGPLPVFIWVMGSNVQACYHQSLHEILASWGWLVLAPDTRELRFADLQYHNRVVLLAMQTLDLASAGELGYNIDETRITAGGYSVGAPLAAFLAARRHQVDALVYWAPSGSPYWTGLNPGQLYPLVTAPSLYILGEFDEDAPPEGGFPDEMQAAMPDAPFVVSVIPGAVHHQFQQPAGADPFSGEPEITRFEQQGEAIRITRQWLDWQYGIRR